MYLESTGVVGGSEQRRDGNKRVKLEPVETARKKRPEGREEVRGSRRREISCGFQ